MKLTMVNQRETNMKHNNCQIKGCGVCNPVHFKKDNQRDTTEFKNLALWKEKDGYVIRKGFGRVGCYIDHLTRQDLSELKNFINIELATDKKWREINEHKRLTYK